MGKQGVFPAIRGAAGVVGPRGRGLSQPLAHKPIGVATHSLTDTLPAELRPFFPSNEELVRRLDAVAAALRGE